MTNITDKQNLKVSFKKWLTEIENSVCLANNIVAVNFDLAEPYQISMIGSANYSPDDEDWACCNDIDEPTGWVDIESILTQQMSWQEVLSLTVEIMQELVNELSDFQLFKVPHISVGFVDGDLVAIK